jgi:hypothetical protein
MLRRVADTAILGAFAMLYEFAVRLLKYRKAA